MRRLLLAALLLAAALPARPETEIERLWNGFARDANRYINTLEAQPERRRRAREKLDREWHAIYACPCF